MSEGLVEGLIGEETPEKLETEAAATGAESVALTVAMDAARFDPELSRKAGEYLDRQRELTELTMKHFDQERRLEIKAAKRKRRFDELKMAFQLVLAVVVVLMILGASGMVYQAVTSRSVVVEAFQAPPGLASEGQSGQVVAEGVLDQLQILEDATRSISPVLATKTAWSSEVKIDIPETGVSLGEIDHLLRQHFGHDIHISGDLTQNAAGELELTIRGDGISPRAFAGKQGELHGLTVQAAEYIYGRSQPYEYLSYLEEVGRFNDALDFVAGAFRRANDNELRAQLANGWGNAFGAENKPAQAIEKYRLAMSLKPRYWTPWSNLIPWLGATEGEEAAWRESQAFLKAVDAAPKKERPPLRFSVNPAQITFDLPLSLRALQEFSSINNGAGAMRSPLAPAFATIYIPMHDAENTNLNLTLSDPHAPESRAAKHMAALVPAVERGQFSAALPEADEFWKFWQETPSVQSGDDSPCLVALVYGLAGRAADAGAIFKRMPQYTRCYAAHGQILEHAGDLAGAEAAWAEGIRIAPDLPLVYLTRGQSRLNRGDLAGAEADFARANAGCPHFADPLKFWGDVLAREGKWKDALAKYDQALNYAPAWPELHQARDQAAGHQ